MNVFDKALKSFNKRAVLQKAALGKAEGSWVNAEGQNVLPPVMWDFVSGPGIALSSNPELPEDHFKLGSGIGRFFSGINAEPSPHYPGVHLNPIHALRERPELYTGDNGGRAGRSLLTPKYKAIADRINGGVISECSVDSSDVGSLTYSAGHQPIDRDTYRVPNYDNFIIRPALKLSYVEAFKLLRLQIIARLNKNCQHYLARSIRTSAPNLHPQITRKMVGRIIQDLLVEDADHLAPYFAEKFGAAF